jgi:predicted RNA binding protein YcfA (HicA-like mRNA interferase family)
VPLPRVTKRSTIIQKFRALGWSGPKKGKSDHPIMAKGSRKQKVPNPHGSGDVGISLLRKILQQAGITEEEWDNA